MARQSFIVRWCRRGSRLCISFINALLMVSLAVLVLGIGSLLLIQSLPVPQWLVRHIEHKLADTGLSISYRSFTTSFRGELILDDLRIEEARTGHLVLSCRRAVARLDYLAALRGEPLRLEDLQFEEAALHGPPEISPVPELPLATVAALELDFAEDRVQFPRILAALGEARVDVRGELPIAWIDSHLKGDASPTPQPWRRQWAAAADMLQSAKRHLERLPGASISIAIRTDEVGRPIASVEGTCPEILLPGELRMREVLLTVPMIDLSQHAIGSGARLEARHFALESPDGNEIRLSRPTVFFRNSLERGTDWQLPAAARISGLLGIPRLPVTPVALEVDLDSLPDTPAGRGRAGVGGLAVVYQGSYDVGARVFGIDFALAGNPDSLIRNPGAGLEKVSEVLRFSGSTRASGSATWQSRESFHARFDLHAREFRTRETDYDEVHAQVRLTPERLVAHPVRVYDPDEQWARGTFIQNLKNRRFRILAEGSIYPRRLDSLLPSFYRDLWKDLDPGTAPAYGDVDVRGIWGGDSRTTSWVTVRGNQFGYRGQSVEAFSGHIWQAGGFVEIFDLRASAAGGTLAGEVGFIFPPDRETAPSRIRLDLDSTLPIELYSGAFEGLEELGRQLSTHTPPAVSIRGETTRGPGAAEGRDLRIVARSQAPVEAYGVPLEALEVTARSTPDLLLLGPIHFTLARGSGHAEAVVRTEENGDQRLHFNGTLQGAEYTTTHSIASAWRAAPREATGTSVTDRWASLPASERGQLDLHLEANGTIGSWNTYSGHGAVAIRQAPLGQIDLFGGLSRLFSSLGINLTSFRLESLTSELILAPGFIGFPNLTVRGPTVNIESQGRVSVPAAELDFDAKIFFLDTENPSIRSLFGMLLRPFGHALEVTVSGPVDEPVWAFRHNPLNLLRPNEETAPNPAQPPDSDPLSTRP